MLYFRILMLFCLGCQTTAPIVETVLSGDTIMLNDGTLVRYAGLQAPSSGTSFFEFCRQANAYLVENKAIKLIAEPNLSSVSVSTIVAYVYTPIVVEGKETKYLFVNAELVRFGLAKAASLPPNLKHKNLWQNLIDLQEQEAKPLHRGIWSQGDSRDK